MGAGNPTISGETETQVRAACQPQQLHISHWSAKEVLYSHSNPCFPVDSKFLWFLFFFLFFYFICGPSLKSVEFVTILLLFYVLGFLAIRHVGSELTD